MLLNAYGVSSDLMSMKGQFTVLIRVEVHPAYFAAYCHVRCQHFPKLQRTFDCLLSLSAEQLI